MSRGRAWEPHENQFIIKYYLEKGAAWVSEKLTNRTTEAVQQQRHKLAHKKKVDKHPITGFPQ
tara:strand:+ start:195 stop:383 length:189 start_codon:yes stop_codon:yes gene_type:complete